MRKFIRKEVLKWTCFLTMISAIVLYPNMVTKAETYGDYEYEVLKDQTVEITRYTGSSVELEIPSAIAGCKVSSIGHGAFQWRESLESVKIPDSVTSIGYSAFYGCKNLNDINIPNGVISIRENTFNGCSLNNINLPANLKYIREGAFEFNSFEQIHLPENLIAIGDTAFLGCENLKSITIPKKVSEIGKSVFSQCESFTQIIVDQANPAYTAPDGVLYDKEMQTLISYPEGKADTSYILPNGIVRIEEKSMRCPALEQIEFPDTIKEVGAFALSGSGWMERQGEFAVINGILVQYQENEEASITPANVEIPDTVWQIGDEAFAYCDISGNLIIPQTVTTIGEEAFAYCDIAGNHVIPKSVTEIGKYAFEGSSWMTDENDFVVINGILVKYQGDEEHVTLPTGITQIGAGAFESCSLKSITIPQGITRIGETAFAFCDNLTEVILPEGITEIDDYAFVECWSLRTVEIPNTVTRIGKRVFQGCSIPKIDIPASVEDLEENPFCFSNVWELSVDSRNRYYSSLNGMLFNKEKTELIAVGSSAVQYSVPDGVVKIREYAFANQNKTIIDLPDSVDCIEKYAFGKTLEGYKGFHEGIFTYPEDSLNYAGESIIIQNPDCNIYDNGDTICFQTIYGIQNSTAQEYADRYDKPFSVINFQLKLSSTQNVMEEGGLMWLSANIMLDNIRMKNTSFKWSSSNPEIAFVESNTNDTGYIRAVKEGTAVITVETQDGSNLKAECVVTVTKKKPSDNQNENTSSSSTNAAVNKLSVGSVFTDEKTKISYLVESVQENLVSVKEIADKEIKSMSISSTVTFSGVEYKVTGIGAKAFYNCKKLKKITIPSSISKIGSQAFRNCKKLKNITVKTTMLTKKNVGKKAFKGIHAKATIRVPKQKLKEYQKLFRSKGAGAKAKYKK